jgi:hypothetical protein
VLVDPFALSFEAEAAPEGTYGSSLPPVSLRLAPPRSRRLGSGLGFLQLSFQAISPGLRQRSGA